jgi:hypothetical protein
VKNYFYSNEYDFYQLLNCVKEIPNNDQSEIKIRIDENSDYDEINSILSRLKEQYQNQSYYNNFFSYIDINFDKEGNVMFRTLVKSDNIPSGNGIDSPNVMCYELVYVDENYEDTPVKRQEPFYDNWYTYSFHTYTG